MEPLNGRVARVAADRTSGASALTAEVLSILADALGTGVPLRPVAQALVRAQPSMAPIWNAVRAALSGGTAEALQQYLRQVSRAPRSLERYAHELLLLDASPHPLKLVTVSFSGTVLHVLQTLAKRRRVQVSDADGLPALEGRHMSGQLAAAGVAVTHYTDAALGHALNGADALLVGADAVTPDWFLNKSGTRMLAAAAGHQGVPVYVLATRDKFLSRAVAARLAVREESPAEVWPAPPPGVTVRNPYFEATPLDLVSAVVSDVGVLGGALVPDACPTAGDEILLEL